MTDRLGFSTPPKFRLNPVQHRRLTAKVWPSTCAVPFWIGFVAGMTIS